MKLQRAILFFSAWKPKVYDDRNRWTIKSYRIKRLILWSEAHEFQMNMSFELFRVSLHNVWTCVRGFAAFSSTRHPRLPHKHGYGGQGRE